VRTADNDSVEGVVTYAPNTKDYKQLDAWDDPWLALGDSTWGVTPGVTPGVISRMNPGINSRLNLRLIDGFNLKLILRVNSGVMRKLSPRVSLEFKSEFIFRFNRDFSRRLSRRVTFGENLGTLPTLHAFDCSTGRGRDPLDCAQGYMKPAGWQRARRSVDLSPGWPLDWLLGFRRVA